jgi:hypothetical protein
VETSVEYLVKGEESSRLMQSRVWESWEVAVSVAPGSKPRTHQQGYFRGLKLLGKANWGCGSASLLVIPERVETENHSEEKIKGILISGDFYRSKVTLLA